MSVRKLALLVAALMGTVSVLASAAWACSDFTQIDSVTPSRVPAAATAEVKGSGAKANSTVELRWNSLNGPVIASAVADPSGVFVAQATVPEVPAGLYTMLVTDGVGDAGRAPFEVVPMDVDGALAPGSPGNVASLQSWSGASPQSGLPSAAVIVTFGSGLMALALGTVVVAVNKRRRVLVTG